MGRIISKMGLIMEEVGDNKIIIQFYFVNFADCKVCYLNMFQKVEVGIERLV